jgi:hypothetical protein
MLPPSAFSRKTKDAMRYKATINEPYFQVLETPLLVFFEEETPLLVDWHRCQEKKASTLRQLIDTAQYCISRYANSGHINRKMRS